MLIEIHVLQNFAPANLNRDDTGAAKDCQFGEYRRARVSSQCWKRAVREYFQEHALFTNEELASRTKRGAAWIAEFLSKERPDSSGEDAMKVALGALKALKIKTEKDQQTNVLLYLGHDQVQRATKVCMEKWDDLLKLGAEEEKGAGEEKKEAGSAATKKNNKKETNVSKELKGLDECFKGSRAVDLALFGRMIAEQPSLNVEAACQVAHAISTHAISAEFDYYTAVDDRNRSEDTGAGMIGTTEFNSACYYRYANVDLRALTKNLEGDGELAQRGAMGFLKSFIHSIPKAKQNSFAAQNPPSMVLVVLRDSARWSLANAFVNPVRPGKIGILRASTEALLKEWDQMCALYGGDGVQAVHTVNVWDAGSEWKAVSNPVKPQQHGSFSSLVQHVEQALSERK